jgi:hypothetical protein
VDGALRPVRAALRARGRGPVERRLDQMGGSQQDHGRRCGDHRSPGRLERHGERGGVARSRSSSSPALCRRARSSSASGATPTAPPDSLRGATAPRMGQTYSAGGTGPTSCDPGRPGARAEPGPDRTGRAREPGIHAGAHAALRRGSPPERFQTAGLIRTAPRADRLRQSLG